jgi:hypothetical protein
MVFAVEAAFAEVGGSVYYHSAGIAIHRPIDEIPNCTLQKSESGLEGN